jgi:DNA-binding IclR family transcriptional regulator
MIQVVQKLFRILELMRDGEAVSIKYLAAETGYDKGSLCNLLKTLVDLGYLEKPGSGQYRLTEKFAALGMQRRRAEEVERVCTRCAARLAERTEESGVVSTLRNGKVEILAQAQHPRRVMVQISHYRDLSLYHSASGRALLCGMEAEEAERLARETGLPASGQWPHTGSLAAFRRGLRELRAQNPVVLVNLQSEISSFAVPVRDGEGRLCAALGLTVPVFRMTPESQGHLFDTLRQCAEALEADLRDLGLVRDDFMKGHA